MLSRLILAALMGTLAGCHKPVTSFPSPTPAGQSTPLASPSATQAANTSDLAEEIHVRLDGDAVEIQVPTTEPVVYRSYSPVYGVPRENRVALKVEKGKARDNAFPDGVKLHYATEPSGGRAALTAVVDVPARRLPTLHTPTFLVDKLHYTLEVSDGGRVVKRYPIALGALPGNRKYCQDMASTPEGWYQVYNLQPQATYYKAFDIDYPRPIDQVRHKLFVEKGEIEADRPIGGEIQIHGLGVGHNWTAGCMAMRNEDIDELFAEPAISAGLQVYIYGYQFGLGDREWLRDPPPEAVRKVQSALKAAGAYMGPVDGALGDGTATALGRYQIDHGLPDSCQLDSRTRVHFGLGR